MTRLMSLMILVTVLFAVNAHAVVQSSANFTMNSNVLDSGGGSASSASFQSNGTIGQPSPVGPTSSTNFNLISGYSPTFLLQLEILMNDMVLNLPSGVTVLFNDNSSSNVLHGDTASTIAVADVDNNDEDDIIVSFPAGTGPDSNGGTYISRNQGPLVSLDIRTAEQVAVGDLNANGLDDLLIDFGVDGLSLWVDDSFAVPFIPLDPTALASGDIDNNGQDDMVMSFPGVGTISLKNFTTIVVLDSTIAETIQTADVDNNGQADVIVSFAAGNGPGGTGGTYISRNDGALVLLDARTAEQLAVGDLNANGLDDLLIDYGVDGLNLWVDDSFAVPFIPLDPEALASGDLDNNGQDDMVMSFPGVGTISLKNFTTIDVLDAAVAQDLAVGAIDGN